jgi:hypothetical protein
MIFHQKAVASSSRNSIGDVIDGGLELGEKLDSPCHRKRSTTKRSERKKVFDTCEVVDGEFCPVRNHGLLIPLIASAVPELAMI